MQGQFQDLGDIEIARQDIGFFPGRPGFDAAAGNAAGPGIIEGFAQIHQFLDDGFAVIERRLAPALAGDFQSLPQEAFRRLLGNLNVGARLEEAHVVHDFQDEIAYIADATGPVGPQGAGIDVAEIGIRRAFLEGNTHFRRCRLVIELDPQRFQELLGIVPGQAPFGQVPVIERFQILVELAWRIGIPVVHFRRHADMGEPVHLDGLAERLWPVFRDDVADGGDIQQVPAPGRVFFFRRHVPGQGGIAFPQEDHAPADPGHAFPFVPFFQGIHIVIEIEAGQAFLDVPQEIAIALPVYLAIGHGMARTALLQEFREHTGSK